MILEAIVGSPPGTPGSGSRLRAHVEALTGSLGHADRATPFRSCCTGLLLPGARKTWSRCRANPGTGGAAFPRPHPSKRLPYPTVTNPAALPIRPGRHVATPMTTLRTTVARAPARTLPRCPCCQRQIEVSKPMTQSD